MIGGAYVGDAVEVVHDAIDPLDQAVGGARCPLERSLVGPEELHLDGIWVAAEVSDHVL